MADFEVRGLKMNQVTGIVIRAFLISFALFSPPGYAEDVKGYSDCDVCPGSVHYGSDEAKTIIGSEGLALIRKMSRSNREIIKVDLDGVLRNGSLDNGNTGYEIEIDRLQNIVYIKSLLDGSYIQIVTDELNARLLGFSPAWHPEIYLQSSQSDKIRLEDTVTGAWEKMKKSHIYDWVFCGQNYLRHPDLLGNKILYALGLVTGNKP